MNILLSHGSPDEAHSRAVEALAAKVAAELGEAVGTAFLGDGLPRGAKVLPLFLTRGRHLEQDVPAQAGAAGAELLAGPADFPAEVADMALELARAARAKQRAVMFALYRLAGAEELMSELYDRSKQFPLPAIAGLHGHCDAASVLTLWRDEGLKEALVQPVLMFPGHSMELVQETTASSGLECSIGPTLGGHEGFAAWLAGRFREAG